MFSRARVAAACSVALVVVTVCALVALRGAAPDQPSAATAPAATTPAATTQTLLAPCDDQCRAVALLSNENWGNGYVIGSHGASCDDCGFGRKCFTADPPEQGDGEPSVNPPVNGEVCCCARASVSRAPAPPPAPMGSTRCADFCAEGGFGYGLIMGDTAPGCTGNCRPDCSGECSTATEFFSDFGSACVGNNKVCCCARYLAAAEPTPRMPDHPSCNDWCLSAGYARGDIDGSPPFCEGDCDNSPACFLATDMLSDYGESCNLGGVKRCRCWS
ncbi:hypothetical protein KFE25_004471 [Diacronema lutheri]|uniref:Uncharacterized protein n=1 Tax=Diacronema lutheri TaxID=2081491 RepID=A0A8J6CA86_DIALT|nr:hypothetical protein KFE25_004471 [Diacronema lutheri]